MKDVTTEQNSQKERDTHKSKKKRKHGSSPSYSRGFRFALTGMAQGIELA